MNPRFTLINFLENSSFKQVIPIKSIDTSLTTSKLRSTCDLTLLITNASFDWQVEFVLQNPHHYII